jgi:hypothetical protein
MFSAVSCTRREGLKVDGGVLVVSTEFLGRAFKLVDKLLGDLDR